MAAEVAESLRHLMNQLASGIETLMETNPEMIDRIFELNGVANTTIETYDSVVRYFFRRFPLLDIFIMNLFLTPKSVSQRSGKMTLDSARAIIAKDSPDFAQKLDTTGDLLDTGDLLGSPLGGQKSASLSQTSVVDPFGDGTPIVSSTPTISSSTFPTPAHAPFQAPSQVPQTSALAPFGDGISSTPDPFSVPTSAPVPATIAFRGEMPPAPPSSSYSSSTQDAWNTVDELSSLSSKADDDWFSVPQANASTLLKSSGLAPTETPQNANIGAQIDQLYAQTISTAQSQPSAEPPMNPQIGTTRAIYCIDGLPDGHKLYPRQMQQPTQQPVQQQPVQQQQQQQQQQHPPDNPFDLF